MTIKKDQVAELVEINFGYKFALLTNMETNPLKGGEIQSNINSLFRNLEKYIEDCIEFIEEEAGTDANR